MVKTFSGRSLEVPNNSNNLSRLQNLPMLQIENLVRPY